MDPILIRPPLIAALRALTVLLSLCACGPAAVADADPRSSKEYQIKAAFVLNFAKFLEWPAEHFTDDSQPIAIGVIGDTPLATELEKIVRDRKVRGRTVTVTSAKSGEEVSQVHMLFVGAGQSATFAHVREQAQNGSVLTIGESPEFAAAGGIITFTIEGDKVRFAINMIAAEQAHLKISAQLQQLATSVRRRP